MKKNKTIAFVIAIILIISTFAACTNNTDKTQNETTTEQLETTSHVKDVNVFLSGIANEDDFKTAYGTNNFKITETNESTNYSVDGKFYDFDGKYELRKTSDNNTFLIFTSFSDLKLSQDKEGGFIQTEEDKKINEAFITKFINFYHKFCKENNVNSQLVTFNNDKESTSNFSDDDLRKWISDLYTLEDNLIQFQIHCFLDNGKLIILEVTWYDYATVAFSTYKG